ncbi:IclR family transcriptional regulator [Desulfatirhabdium butyrativorans]|uniref:IclR family transcriptional regulator n=1 Tax=Desulfatirhabdium butyrativorans TaxID=340467 RepID=UPI0004066022|nr:IclR family transcriptional regulator [Desulfatirhabdium butyrativorans]
MTTTYKAPAVQKAFQILKTLVEAQSPLGISDLSRQLGIGKSTVHGLIASLIEAGAIERTASEKAYVLGPALVDLAFRSWSHLFTAKTIAPILDELRDSTGLTVFLGVLSRERTIIVATSASRNALAISSPPGTTIPMLAGALGKLYIAALDTEQATNILTQTGLTPYTDHSIQSVPDYLAECAFVRSTGFAFDDEEYIPGVRAVATRVGQYRGLLLALWVVGFSKDLERHDDPGLLQAISSCADRVRKELDQPAE